MSYEKHANAGGAPLFENLRKLINVIDDLRDVGLHKYISLPRIAVLGTQSSGKSSLLESIVGMDFLPRGDGVVTRRPLELRLVRSLKIKTPYGEFEQIKGEKFEDFTKIKEKIEWLTDSVAGKDKGIVDDPIILTVYSPTCPDLTIIDLPGITRIPIAGQAKNIEEITKNMCARYCKDDRTIILAVIPANQDLTTSEGLQMAQALDPKGDRTLAVLTKIDIMDRGTNAKKVLQNQEVHLRYGFVGVKNRSQFDIQTGVKVKQALENEKNFFMGHPIYSTMPGNVGTEALVQKLTVILYSQIRKCLPDIIREINTRTKEAEDRLKELGEPLPSTDTEKLQLLWNMITEFTEKFKNVIKGKYDGSRVGDQKEISSGTRIKGYFYDIYKEFYEKDKIDIDYSDGDISRAIRLHQGDAIPGFLSIDSFLFLIHPLLQRLKEPAYECLTGIYSHLEDLARGILTKVFERFPQISEEIVDSVIKILQERRDNTREIIDNIMEYENSYIFTNDDAYVSKTNVIPQNQGQTPTAQEKKAAPIDANTFFVHEMRNRIEAYYSVVVRNGRDTIPKTIGYFMVRKSMEEMQYSLYNAITKNPLIFKLVGEPEHIVLERTNANKLLETLRKAQKVLKRDPDLAVMPSVEDTEELMEKVTKKEKSREEEKHDEKHASRQSSSTTLGESQKPAPAPAPTQPPAQTTVPAQPVTAAPTDKKPAPAGGNLFGGAAPTQPAPAPAKPTTTSNSLFGK